jgi:uncharacterized protein (TIGR02453 family)
MADQAFAGFPRGTFTFLSDLAANNNKAWFDAHRQDYEDYYVAPARDFVSALGPRLKAISSTVQFEPRINGSIFRINRDVRFAKDKSPYQTKLDLWFWHGDRKGWNAPGFFLRIAPDMVGMGAGMHGLAGPQLAAFRDAVVEERSGRALVRAVDEVRTAGPYEIRGASRKTVPRGFDADGPRASLLLHESLWANLEAKPAEAMKPTFVGFVFAHLKAMAPIARWLLTEVAPKAEAKASA